MRLLVVEDERDMNRLLKEALERADYSVDACFDGEEALDYLRLADYDAIVLDVMMPRLDGYGLLTGLRQAGDGTPVIFLTARDGLEDRVRGLDMGADDYLVKPFAMDELLARLRVVTRKHSGASTNVYMLADLSLDTVARRAWRGQRELLLSAKELSILEYMLRHKGEVLSREQIMGNAWNYDYLGSSNVVDVYISHLRKKLEAEGEQKLLHTVWGTGWVLRE